MLQDFYFTSSSSTKNSTHGLSHDFALHDLDVRPFDLRIHLLPTPINLTPTRPLLDRIPNNRQLRLRHRLRRRRRIGTPVLRR